MGVVSATLASIAKDGGLLKRPPFTFHHLARDRPGVTVKLPEGAVGGRARAREVPRKASGAGRSSSRGGTGGRTADGLPGPSRPGARDRPRVGGSRPGAR